MNHVEKNKIKICFNKAWKTYDNNCSVQNKICERATEKLKEYRHEYGNVADFACGIGLSTQYIVDSFSYKRIYAIDFSEKLLILAKEKLENQGVQFVLSDFDMEIFPKGYLDLVFCNMGLQWSMNLKKTLGIFYCYLRSSGYCVFTTPMADNFPEMTEHFKNIFYTMEETLGIISKSCYEIIFHEKVFL